MEAVFDDTLPYIAAWHQAPVRIDRDLAYLHLQLFSVRRAVGKLKYLAGSESAMGAFVSDVRPGGCREDAPRGSLGVSQRMMETRLRAAAASA